MAGERKDKILQATLLARPGWNPGVVKRYGLVPKLGVNPFNRSCPKKLFDLEKVLEIEALPEFQELVEKKKKLSEIAKRRDAPERVAKRVEARRKNDEARALKMVEYAKNAEIAIKKVEDVIGDAVNFHREWRWKQGLELPCRKSREEWAAIVLAHVLMELSNYQELARPIIGKRNSLEAKTILLERTFDAIDKAYPELRIRENPNFLNAMLDYGVRLA